MPEGAPGAGSARTAGLTLALLGAIAFSGKAIVAKLLYRHGVDAILVVCLRMLFAMPFFVLMAWWGGRGKPSLTPRQWRQILVLGITGYYLASVLDFLGLQYISAGLERLILYVYPTLVLLIGLMRGGRHGVRRLHARQMLAMAVSYAGVVLAFGAEAQAGLAQSGSHLALGTALVFGSAAAYAVYLVLSGDVVGQHGAARLTGLASLVACVLCIGQFFVLRPGQSPFVSAPVVWLSLLNATLCTVLPMWMVMRGIELIGPALTAQVGMIGPLSTVLLGVWLLGEPFTLAMAAGTLLVLAGIALLARAK